uniref:Uncharacterized protein n=1 Tax=Helianthus annuus TaxID=4232 RepID=A0A251T3C7_HELAN
MVWSGDHRARFKLKTLTLFSPSCQYDRHMVSYDPGGLQWPMLLVKFYGCVDCLRH